MPESEVDMQYGVDEKVDYSIRQERSDRKTIKRDERRRTSRTTRCG